MSRSIFSEGISKIVKEFKLNPDFSRKALEEVERHPAEIPLEEGERRVDLREETIVTIDGEKARDFDDAVSVSERPEGGFRLKVSIADVSHYVRTGSHVDREAYQRATSVYFPDRVIPMLPERLSNDLCSLVPHQDRLSFTAEMDFDEKGNRLAGRFYKSVIRSAARLTYTLVRQILVDESPEADRIRGEHRHLIPVLRRMERLYERLREVRRARGSLDFDLPEPDIQFDMEEISPGEALAHTIAKIVKAERNMAHRLIEEFMIAANEAVAEFVTERGLPMVYRIHDEPDPERVRDFALLLHNLGFSLRMGRRPEPRALSAVIDAVRGRPEERLINTILLRTMKKAVYDVKNVGHYGLASECYTHFTSPIRRYPDLIVHRVLEQALSQTARRGPDRRHKIPKRGRSESGPLSRMAQHCSEQERGAMKAEWASRDLAAALFLSKKVGERFDGIISNVTKFGFFVELTPFFVEGLVPLRDLRDDHYIFVEKTHQLIGRRKKKKYQIGQPIKVRVRGVNLEKRWVDFEIS